MVGHIWMSRVMIGGKSAYCYMTNINISSPENGDFRQFVELVLPVT